MNNVTIAILEHNATYKFFETLFETSSLNWCFLDKVDYQADMTYIILTPGVPPIPPKDRKARVILWDLEPYYHTFDAFDFDEVWTFSEHYAHLRGYKFVPMSAHTNFPDIVESDGSQWDVVHLSSQVPRRKAIYDQLELLRLRVPGGLWAHERHEALSTARMMLNVFPFADFKVISPIRPLWAAMYRIPLICEAGGDTMGLSGRLIEVGYNDIAIFCKQVSQSMLDAYRYRLWDYLVIENPIEKVIAANV